MCNICRSMCVYVEYMCKTCRSHIIALRIPSLLSRAAVPVHMSIAKLTALGTNSDKTVEKLPVWKPWRGFYNLSWSRFDTTQLKATGGTSKFEFSPASLQNCTRHLCDCCSSGFHFSIFSTSYQSSTVRATLCNSTDFSHTLAVCEYRWQSCFHAYFHKKAYCSLTLFCVGSCYQFVVSILRWIVSERV